MNKIFSFGIDEDSCFFNDEFDNIEVYFENIGKYIGEVFLNEYDSIIVEKIELLDIIDYDGCENELENIGRYVKMVEIYIVEKDYVIVSFCVGYDNSFLVLSKNNYEKLLKMCDNVIVN